jgi:hypothetical protein
VSGFRGDPKAGGNSSRGIAAFHARFADSGWRGPAVLALGLAAAVLMVLTELTELFSIQVDTASCSDLASPDLADACRATGGEQHSYALIPVAVLTAAMAAGAGLGGSRPAAFALLAAGALVLGIALLGDLPATTSTGEIGSSFTSAEATKGPALWLELAGGALAALAGLLSLRRLRGYST